MIDLSSNMIEFLLASFDRYMKETKDTMDWLDERRIELETECMNLRNENARLQTKLKDEQDCKEELNDLLKKALEEAEKIKSGSPSATGN